MMLCQLSVYQLMQLQFCLVVTRCMMKLGKGFASKTLIATGAVLPR